MNWLFDYLIILKMGLICENTTRALYPLRAGLKDPAFYLLLQCHISALNGKSRPSNEWLRYRFEIVASKSGILAQMVTVQGFKVQRSKVIGLTKISTFSL